MENFLMKKRRVFPQIFLSLLIFFGGVIPDGVFAQNAKTKISLSCENEQMSSVLKKVEDISNFKILFIYNEIQNFKVTIKLQSKTIEEVMQAIVTPFPLAFTIKGKYITVSRKKEQGTKAITGTVCDIYGIPLLGVNIQTNDKSISGITDKDGHFNIPIPDEKQVTDVTFSYIGMKKVSVHFTGERLSVTMKDDAQKVGEVVITGIFDRKAESFTGAATVINQEELMKNGSQNLLQNLKNIDPGFKIIENINFGSDPNRMPEIQLRGQQGIPDIKGTYGNNPNQPLFILDGFEADITTVFDLDMNRIKTVVLLKDAAAKAIYGARAANGVVVIETHKPQEGKLRFSYKGDLNISAPDLTGYNLCNAREKYEVEKNNSTGQGSYFKEKYLNSVLADIERGVDTYWLSKPLHTGVGQRHSLYMEGGDQHIRYGINLLYNDVKGVMRKSGRKTFTGGFNFSYRYKNLLFRNLFNVSLNRADDSPYGSFSLYTSLNPYWTPYDADGNLKKIAGVIGGGGLMEIPIGNPLWDAQIGTKNFSKYTELTNNFYIEWNILEYLKLTGRIGISQRQNLREDFYPASHSRFASYKEERFFERGTYDKTDGKASSIRSDLNANYSFSWHKHQFFLNAGFNLQQNTAESVILSVVGFPNELMNHITAGKEYRQNARPGGSESISRELGFLTAMNYAYDDRYLADLSYRATGSSMFGKNNRWGQFWSAGIGWNLHKESFLAKVKWLKLFKLRLSSGYTGSQRFNPYQALATFGYYQTHAYDNWVGSYLLGLPNDNLKWQRTQDYNIGCDLNLLGHFNLRCDYYIQETKDQLLDMTIPPSMGFVTYKENLGSTQNKGMEMKVNTHILMDTKNNRYLSAFFSIARNSNKIKKISKALQSYNDANDKQLSEGKSNEVKRPLPHYVEGRSMTAIWAVRSLGIDQITGDAIFLTRDGKTTTEWNVSDQVVCGDAMPKYTGNFGLNMDYAGWFLNLSFHYRLGGQVYNQTLVDRVENANILYNVDKRINSAIWKKPGDIVSYSYSLYKMTKPSSRFIQDVNELQLSSLNIGYDFKHCTWIKRVGLKRLKVSFYMDDVFRASSVKVERGLDYPFARTYSFSLQTTF